MDRVLSGYEADTAFAGFQGYIAAMRDSPDAMMDDMQIVEAFAIHAVGKLQGFHWLSDVEERAGAVASEYGLGVVERSYVESIVALAVGLQQSAQGDDVSQATLMGKIDTLADNYFKPGDRQAVQFWEHGFRSQLETALEQASPECMARAIAPAYTTVNEWQKPYN